MDSRLETFSIYQHGSRVRHDGLQKDQKRGCGLTTKAFVHLLPTCYLDLLPFKLRDPPNESFNKLFKACLHAINNFEDDYYAKHLLPPKQGYVISFELDEIEDDLDTLQLQKYYICYYIVNYVKTQPLLNDQLPPALMMSILPWYIDDESEDARTLEKMLMENVHKQIGDLTGNSYCWT